MDLRTDRPHSARVYDYLLGGKDNFAADRDAADAMVANNPNLPTSMRANRRFMARVVHYLAAERGIRQFLDIGTGLPTSPNLHEVVQQVDPTSRVVYVDNDPIVLVHARALLTSDPRGRTAYIAADLREADKILHDPQLTESFDLHRPVALSLIAVLQHVTDDDEARQIIARLMAPLAAGSTLTISAVTSDTAREENEHTVQTYRRSGIPLRSRSRAEVERLFEGFDLIEPGVTLVHRWRPAEEDRTVADSHVFMYGGVALKS